MGNLIKVRRIIFIVLMTWALLMGQVIAGQNHGQQDISSFTQEEHQILIDRLRNLTRGKVQIAAHAMTGKVRYIGVDPSDSIPQPSMLSANPTPEEAARGFLSTYGPLFGLIDQVRELKVRHTKRADRNRSFVRFQQTHEGIPIIGGELIVQVDSLNNIISTHGKILPDIFIDTSSSVTAEMAKGEALAVVFKYYHNQYHIDISSLQVSQPELWIYKPILFGENMNFTRLVWRMEVFPTELIPIKELVLVDAHLGNVALHFNQIDTALYRKIYDHNNTPGKPLPGSPSDLKRSEGQGPSGIADVDYAYDFAGDTYNFYWNYHGRDSIDNAGRQLISTTRYCPPFQCPYKNAFWNGFQMVYGQGFASADDVVAHEMTHGVTDYESNLFYYMQSGAINEAFSDIWGEFVDLTNGRGNDSSSVRWLMGEDLPIGPVRSMSNPPAYGDPDRMRSSYYYCGSGDNGGVHINSGVANKAAYLMTDGGNFNGITVTDLGITKVAKIFYEAQTNLLTSASDYGDLYDALLQACTNLVGTSGITTSDCQQVKNAIDAVEMNQQPVNCPVPETPKAATLISPSGTITTNTPTYVWNAVSNSTDYYLWVDDSTGNRIKQWYTASACGCGSGTDTCSLTPAIRLAAGAAQWKVQTKNTVGFGPWSTPMSFTVLAVNSSTVDDTLTINKASQHPFQRKSFYANTRYWVFYSDGTNMVYRTSTDGSSWSSTTTVRACDNGYKFSVWFDGIYCHYAYSSESVNTPLYYCRGIPGSGGTITWNTEREAKARASGTHYYMPCVVSDSGGYPWIAYKQYGRGNYLPYVTKSSTNDGTWSTAPNFPYYTPGTGSWSDWVSNIVPLTNQKVYFFYARATRIFGKVWTGSSWGSEQSITNNVYDGKYHSAVAEGDNVHLGWMDSSKNIKHNKRTYSGIGPFYGSWGTGATVQASVESASAPVLSIDTTNNFLFCFWGGSPTANHVYYKKRKAGTWDTNPIDWIDESTDGLGSSYRFTSFYKDYGGHVGLVYMTKTTSNYKVRFAERSGTTVRLK